MIIIDNIRKSAAPLKRMKLDCALTVTKALTENGQFEGYGSVFDVLDMDREVVVRGAFARSLQERGEGGIKMLWQHRTAEPIGIWPLVKEDERGLSVQGQLATSTTRGGDAHELLKLGALDGLSIGFRTVKSEIDEDTRVRRLIEIDLWEISLVTFPANTQARVSAVKQDDDMLQLLAELGREVETERDFERLLRDAGFSHREAVAITAHGFKVARRGMHDAEGSTKLLSVLRSAEDAFKS